MRYNSKLGRQCKSRSMFFIATIENGRKQQRYSTMCFPKICLVTLDALIKIPGCFDFLWAF